MNNKCGVSALNRRQFLVAVGVAGLSIVRAGGASASSLAQGSASAGQLLMQRPITMTSLKRHVGSKFRIQGSNGKQFVGVLDRVDEDRHDEALEQFTAVFRLKSKTAEFPQDVYELSHRKLGHLSLLLSPGGNGPRKFMSAAFCNLR